MRDCECYSGANPNQPSHTGHQYPIIIAAAAGDTSIVRSLLRADADPDVVSKHGSTAVSEACYYSHGGVLYILLQANADTSHESVRGSPLVVCAQRNSSSLAELLVDAGADPQYVSGTPSLHNHHKDANICVDSVVELESHTLDTMKIL